MSLRLPTTFAGLVNMANERNLDLSVLHSVLCSDEDTARIRKLHQQAKVAIFFECNGTYFKGNRSMAIIAFTMENPEPADFYVWLQKNYKIYCPVS